MCVALESTPPIRMKERIVKKTNDFKFIFKLLNSSHVLSSADYKMYQI